MLPIPFLCSRQIKHTLSCGLKKWKKRQICQHAGHGRVISNLPMLFARARCSQELFPQRWVRLAIKEIVCRRKGLSLQRHPDKIGGVNMQQQFYLLTVLLQCSFIPVQLGQDLLLTGPSPKAATLEAKVYFSFSHLKKCGPNYLWIKLFSYLGIQSLTNIENLSIFVFLSHIPE